MTVTQILKWAEIGAQLVTILGVPVAAVVKLFRDNGGTDAEAAGLLLLWGSLTASIDARIAELQAQISRQ